MNTAIRHIRRLLLLGVVVFGGVSCRGLIEHYAPICDYTVQLRYDYNQENTTTDNLFGRYVKSTEQYIFDGQGVLYAVAPVTADPCTGQWVSQLDLPPGRYSVIAVGNRDTRSRISDGEGGPAPEIGVTRREDMRMTLENAEPMAEGRIGPSERIYHGYRTFSVLPDRTSLVRVDMVHSHMVLRIRVTWRNSAPADEHNVTMTLGDVTPGYSLMPEYVYKDNSGKVHDPQTDDGYRVVDNSVIHHIPVVREDIAPRNTYQLDSYINGDKTVNVEFVSYRIRKSGGSVVTLTGNGGPLMDDVDLTQWFADKNIELDRNLKQDFALEFMIGDDRSVTINALSMEDWFEGGTIH